MSISLRRHLAPGVLLVLAPLFLFPAVICRGDVLYLLDISIQNHPFQDYSWRCLEQGRLPLWCRFISCGFPLFAEGQSGILYPLNIVSHLLFPGLRAITAATLLHFMITGLGMYCYLTGERHSRFAATLAAFSWSSGSYFMQHYMLTPFFACVAWLPWGFASLSDISRNRYRTAFWLTGIVALQMVAGHPPGLFLSLVSYALFFAVREMSNPRERVREMPTRILIAGGAVGLGLIIGAVQILPTWELAQQSSRASGLDFETMTAMSLPPRWLITLLIPGYFGAPADDSAWAVSDGYHWEFALYPGLLMVFMACLGIRNWRRRREQRHLILMAFGAVLMLGKYTPLYGLLRLAPGASFFRIPARFSLLFLFGLLALAAAGIDRWRINGQHDRSPRLFFVAATVVMLFSILPNLVFLLGVNRARAFFLSARFFRIETGWLSAVFSAVGCLFVLLLIANVRDRIPNRVISTLLVIYVIIDAKLHTAGFDDALPEQVLCREPRQVATIRERVAAPRILSEVDELTSSYNWHKGWLLSHESYKQLHATLMMYNPVLYSLEGCPINGWSPLHFTAMERLQRTITPALLRLLAVTVYVAAKGALPPDTISLLQDGIKVGRYRAALPTASFGWRAKAVSDALLQQNLLAAVAETRQGQLYTTLPFAAQLSLPDQVSAGTAVVEWQSPNRYRLEVTCEHEGVCLLSYQYEPNWRFTLENEELLSFPVLTAMTGLILPTGNYSVEAQYQPKSLKVGLFMSGAGLMLSIAAASAARRRWKTRPEVRSEEMDPDHASGNALLCCIVLGVMAIGFFWGIADSGWIDSFSQMALKKCIDYAELLKLL